MKKLALEKKKIHKNKIKVNDIIPNKNIKINLFTKNYHNLDH